MVPSGANIVTMKISTLLTALFAFVLFDVSGATHNVDLGGPNGNSFSPSSITINVGDTVVWTNLGGFHNVNGSTSTFPTNPASFGNSVASAPWTYSFVFTTAGTYNYQCDPHAGIGMTGSVNVLGGPVTSTVEITTADFSVVEGDTNLSIDLSITPAASSAEVISVVLIPGAGLDPSDGTTTPAYDVVTGVITLPVSAGQSTASIILNTIDDTVVEMDETAVFSIFSLTSGLVAGSDTSITVTITDNDVSATACSDLFFSEYIEGSSNNKALEIYNPTSSIIDLTPYLVIESGNGGSFTDTLDISGTLAPGAVYTLCTDQADPTLQALSDTILSFPSVAHFNGDDALILWNGTDTLDIIGVPGVDPGSSWPVGTGSTQNHTLVRMPTVNEGTTDWSIGANQWNVNPQNFFSDYGVHTMNPCGGGGNPIVSFQSAGASFAEDFGVAQFNVVISNANAGATTVDVMVNGGSATSGSDYTFTSPTTISFPAGSSAPQTVSVTLTDDALNEGNETIDFQLQNPTNGATIGGGSFTLVITDNDQSIPTYSIGAVTTNDANGEPDSSLVYCAIEGIVLGVNLNGNGAQFTVNDGSDGIAIYSSSALAGFTVNEGDGVRVIGEIDQFSGLTQMYADSAVVLSQGNPIPSPTIVTVLNEDTESELVEIQNVSLVDPTEWTGQGSGFNVDVTDGTNTYTVRIDNEVDLYSQPAPTGTFHVRGIGGQFDSSSPYDSGYQLLPRYAADIIPTISLDENELNVRLYPNPFRSQLIIESDQSAQVRIINSIGSLIYEGSVKEETTLSTEAWSTGLYLIELSTENSIRTYRVIKQ